MEILSCSDQPFYYAEENNNLDALFREVNKLPPKCREIFLESYIDGKKSAEIAVRNVYHNGLWRHNCIKP